MLPWTWGQAIGAFRRGQKVTSSHIKVAADPRDGVELLNALFFWQWNTVHQEWGAAPAGRRCCYVTAGLRHSKTKTKRETMTEGFKAPFSLQWCGHSRSQRNWQPTYQHTTVASHCTWWLKSWLYEVVFHFLLISTPMTPTNIKVKWF